MENWKTDRKAGKTEIQIAAIAPADDHYDTDGKLTRTESLYWVKFDDVMPALLKYDQAHPRTSFAYHIWDDYFLSDVRPEVVK